ncbi:hypothetical protein ACLOAV_002006 [Pseudogymnoascus australis]
MSPHSLRLRRSLDSNTKFLIGTIVVSSILGIFTIVGLYFLFRYCRQRRRNRRSMMNSAEEAWKKQHVAGAWSIGSSEPVSEFQGTETTSESDRHSEPPSIRRNDRFLSVSMPPPRPPRPDDMISPLTPRDIADIPDHLLYSNNSITSRGGEEYRPYSLPSKFPIHRPEVHPPPESHPLPQPPYDSPIDLWYQPPTPPPKSNKRVPRVRSINRKVSIVRKPVPIHFLLSGPRYGGLGGLGGLRRSDTGYSSHYSDASNLERADSVASVAGGHTWAPQSAIDSLAAYSEISALTPFDKTEGVERNLSRRDFASARLSNVVEKEDANEAEKLEGDVEVPDLESDTTSNAGSSDRDTLEVEKKVGEESRVDTPDPIPAPLRIIKKGNELEVPMLKLPTPMSFEERREMGRIYTVR